MTVRDTLTRAIRLTGARSLDDTPSSDEMSVALTAFQAMLDELIALGGPLTDVYVTSNYTANENERVTPSSGSLTISTPATVTDTKTGNARAPLNGAVVEVCGTTPATWVYCSQLAAWQNIKGLTLDSTQPLGPEHEEGLAAMTAMRIFADLQQDQTRQPSATLTTLAEQGRRAIRQRLRQPFIATTDPLLLNVFQRCGSQI